MCLRDFISKGPRRFRVDDGVMDSITLELDHVASNNGHFLTLINKGGIFVVFEEGKGNVSFDSVPAFASIVDLVHVWASGFMHEGGLDFNLLQLFNKECAPLCAHLLCTPKIFCDFANVCALS